MKRLIVGTLCLAGCLVKGPHVPGDLQGDIPVRIANKNTDGICGLLLQPYAETEGRADNWLGASFRQQQIKAGEEREFKVKAGEYRIGLVGCNGTWGGGTARGAGKLVVEGPTYVSVAGRSEPPANFRLAYVPAAPIEQATYDGETASEAPAEEAPAESSSTASSSSSEPEPEAKPAAASAPSGPACKGDGAAVNSFHDCCSAKTHLSADRTKTLCCSSGSDCV